MVSLCWEDFNKLKVSRIQNAFDLKPVETFSTRGRNILDLLLTDLNKLYDSPRKLPPFGLSDHDSVLYHIWLGRKF